MPSATPSSMIRRGSGGQLVQRNRFDPRHCNPPSRSGVDRSDLARLVTLYLTCNVDPVSMDPSVSAPDRPGRRRDRRRFRYRPRHRPRLRRLRGQGGHLGARPRDTAAAAAEEVGGLGITDRRPRVGRGRRGPGPDHGRARPGQHPGEQRRRRLLLAAARDVGERLGRPLPGQPQARHPLHPAGGPGHGRDGHRRAASSASPPSRACGPRRATPPTRRPRPASSTTPRPPPWSWPRTASGSTPWRPTSP